jgi:DNA-binding MurR/RpiR family transcriptional regulator
MTTKELAAASRVSEATVVRFVRRLGFCGYSEFQQELRDLLDAEINLLDRSSLSQVGRPNTDRLHQVVFEGIENLQHFYENVDLAALEGAVERLSAAQTVYVTGSRLSFAPAYLLGWGLTKVRPGVHILKGSDSTCIDWLTNAEGESLLVAFSTTRYPNELIRLGKAARRLGHRLLVIADSSFSPLLSFADHSLIAPSKNIPFYGDLTISNCLIRYLILELASRLGESSRRYQERLEQMYLENDILFNVQ